MYLLHFLDFLIQRKNNSNCHITNYLILDRNHRCHLRTRFHHSIWYRWSSTRRGKVSFGWCCSQSRSWGWGARRRRRSRTTVISFSCLRIFSLSCATEIKLSIYVSWCVSNTIFYIFIFIFFKRRYVLFSHTKKI